jgi:hypothetical protein
MQQPQQPNEMRDTRENTNRHDRTIVHRSLGGGGRAPLVRPHGGAFAVSLGVGRARDDSSLYGEGEKVRCTQHR